jgi:sorbitol/mannitol transport system substrate-binding protein
VLIRNSRRTRALLAVTALGSLALAACSSSSSSGGGAAANTGSSSNPVTLTVAVVANPLMTTIEQLTPSGFEASNPGIKVKFVTLDENTEREDVEKDVATGAGLYDVVMLGPNDIASWAKNKWIDSLNSYTSADASYDVNDLLPPIRTALSANGNLYAVPFYGESSFMMYNKAMFAAAHLTMPLHPTWAQIASFAQQLNDPAKGVAGICLRGLDGWGNNLAALDTVVNTFGGQWFNTSWDAELTTPAFEQATNFYVNLVKNYGEKGAGEDSFNQCLTIMQQQKAAMWYDATVGASTLDAPGSPVQGKIGFAYAPVDKTTSSGWLWTWALALESASKHSAAAWKFMSWATSKQYIAYDAAKNGWASVPPGTRTSTYQNASYQAAAGDFAALTLNEIDSVNINQPGLQPQPVPGIQYVGIPEFETFGTTISNYITAAIDGQMSVTQALQQSQSVAQQAVVQAGYKS